MAWLESCPNSNDLDGLVQKYSKLMSPKPGRCPQKAIAEINRQRNERLERIEKLRVEAAALFVVGRRLRDSTDNQQHSDLNLL